MTVFGIVGATGTIGREMLRILSKRQPTATIRLFASAQSEGTKIMHDGTTVADEASNSITVEEFSIEAAQECDFVLLAESSSFAKKFAPSICEKTVVIDSSSAFRSDDNIPLVIPEINGVPKVRLVANPNCTTSIAALVLWPLHCKFQLKKVIISSYQSAAGAGEDGMQELLDGTRQFLDGEKVQHSIFSHPLPFNVMPHIKELQENGYTKEEMKIVRETQKIFQAKIPISCTAVLTPTLRAHAEAITLETEKPISTKDARAILASAPGVVLVDDIKNRKYPTTATAVEKNEVEVGRIRQSLIFGSYGIDLFVCGDQLLRGAALNAILIAEKYIEQKIVFEDNWKPPYKVPTAEVST